MRRFTITSRLDPILLIGLGTPTSDPVTGQQQRFCAWLDSIGGPDCSGRAGQTRASAHVRASLDGGADKVRREEVHGEEVDCEARPRAGNGGGPPSDGSLAISTARPPRGEK